MKLIGSTTSPYVRKVRVVMAENRDRGHGDSVGGVSAASSATAASGWRVHGVS